MISKKNDTNGWISMMLYENNAYACVLTILGGCLSMALKLSWPVIILLAIYIIC